ncbi:hypothetical protein KDA_00290 [Dictyobacter alpinus]|uniref:HNH nuclease domain-containing protein n=1 Tax=Dictyobacter alpinus TaxID=2014873 RepID=A0A402AZQ3_9CHLR|nr:HNH endonuclease [Dictyobacter alpinus]GCE24545.1 hypothetical protein KDA_00290 [Dictyobacter alpinus]
MKILRPSVMTAREWFKERNAEDWQRIRSQVLEKDHYTCVYCSLTCRKFMQVNHIGAEDNHQLKNLETVCPACHSVMHMGINALQGIITVFECKKELVSMATIVCETRKLVNKQKSWDEIESNIYHQFLRSGGKIYDKEDTLFFANQLVTSIKQPEFRAYLPEDLAIVFHEQGAWNGFQERVWKWQCLPGSTYRKQSEHFIST